MSQTTLPPLECCHASTCLPDYWGGHHKAHISVPVYKGMHLKELKRALSDELNQGAVCGSDDRIRDKSGDLTDAFYRRAQAAINRIKPAEAGKRRLFNDLDEQDEDDDVSIYAYFIFTDLE